MRTSNPLLVIDLRRQAQSVLHMRQPGTQASKRGTDPPEVDVDKGFPGRPFQFPRQLQRLAQTALTGSKALIDRAARVSTPWTGNSRTHHQTGAQLAAVAHGAQVFDGPIIDERGID